MDNEKIYTMLEGIATKLGVASTHLWSILVKEAYITGWEYLISGIILLGLCYKGHIFIQGYNKRSYEDRKKMSNDLGFIEAAPNYTHLYLFVSVFGFFGCVFVFLGIPGILNPEASAFSSLVRVIRW